MSALIAESRMLGKTVLCLAVVAMATVPTLVFAQGNNQGNNQNNFGSVVGGVEIDTNGVLSGKMQTLSAEVRQQLQTRLNSANSDINKASKLRVISLRGLESAIRQSKESGKPLPSEVQFMAGLQRIEYVIVSEDGKDILIAGPGEGWKLDENGVVVGKDSGTPVIHLEDFLVAMRSVQNARQGQGISVSIDPTEEGSKRLSKYLSSLRKFRPNMKSEVERVNGNHNITLTGVPQSSRFAQILVTADYQMKRLSMGLESAPIANMPSLLEILKKNNSRSKTLAPRFWMETSYQPVAKSQDAKVFQLRGQGVKTLTEDSFFNQDGKAQQTGKTNKFAQQWADSMNDRFEELSKAQPVFRELRNLMDMTVVAAIIEREGMLEKVGLDIPGIKGHQNVALIPERNVPKTVPAQCSFVNIRGNWMVTASGGVQVDSWAVAENTEIVKELGSVSATANKQTADRFWWNAAN